MAGTGDTDGETLEQTLEVRVLAIGPFGEAAWLARGRTADGASVDFVTDRDAAERISDALADGTPATALITRRQVLR